MKKNKLGVFPGVFDPFTNGHLAVLQMALKDFETIHIVIMENEDKIPTFSLEQRLNFITSVTAPNIKVYYWPKMAVAYLKKVKSVFLIRGYRNANDLEYEKELKAKYLTQNPKIKVLLYKTSSHLSSSLVKQKINDDQDVRNLVPWERKKDER